MSVVHTLRFIVNHPLNRSHQLRALARFVKWQIGSRLVPGAVVYDWVDGSKFLVRNGETGLTGNIYTGLHEFPDMAFVLHFLRPGDLFADVGANVGSYSILACAVAGARGVAFEPIPSTYHRLVENIRLNHLEECVSCIDKGVGSEPSKLTFTSDGDTINHALANGELCDNAVNVDVTTLDEHLHASTPSLIKIDVEGFETPVLKGAKRVLADVTLNAVIMELNGSGDRYGFREGDIIDLMMSNGFRTYAYDPFVRKLTSLNGKNAESGNTLFVRDKAAVDARVSTADKRLINGMHL